MGQASVAEEGGIDEGDSRNKGSSGLRLLVKFVVHVSYEGVSSKENGVRHRPCFARRL